MLTKETVRSAPIGVWLAATAILGGGVLLILYAYVPRVAAQDSSLRPFYLEAVSGDSELTLTFEPGPGEPTGHEMQYRELDHGVWKGTPSTWSSITQISPGHTVRGLSNIKNYQFRVRGVKGNARSDWATAWGYPRPYVNFLYEDRDQNVIEGDSGRQTVSLTITLSSPNPDHSTDLLYHARSSEDRAWSGGRELDWKSSTATEGEDFGVNDINNNCYKHPARGGDVDSLGEDELWTYCPASIPANATTTTISFIIYGDTDHEGKERFDIVMVPVSGVSDLGVKLHYNIPRPSTFVNIIGDDLPTQTISTSTPPVPVPVDPEPECTCMEAQMVRGDGVVGVRLDELPSVKFEKSDVAVREKRGGNSRDLTVRLSETAQLDMTVNYTVHSDGSVGVQLPSEADRRAMQGEDFHTRGLCDVQAVGICQGSVTIPAGSDSAAIRVRVKDDAQIERREAFKIRIDPGARYVPLARNRAVRIEIVDND